MTLLQSVRNLLLAPSVHAAPTVKQLGGGASFDGILNQMTRYGHFRQLETVDTDAAYKLAVTSAWVYSDIKLIADRLASRDATLKVLKRFDKSVIDTHPFLELLDSPNAFMSGSFFKRYLAWWLWLRGNAYAFIATSTPGKGTPTAFWPLAANMVRPMPETLRRGLGIFRDIEVIDYEYNVNGMLERLPGENIIHLRMPNPFDWWEGMSPLTAALLGIQNDRAQATWQRDFFQEDNAIPSAIISVPSTTSPADFDRQRELIREQLKQGQKRIFTRSGDLTVETITQTLEQMQIIDSRRFSRDEVDRVFGVPEGLISGGLSGDSRLAAEIAFARNTVQPALDYFAEQFTTDLAYYYGDDILFESPNVIPQDRALEVQEYNIYSQDRTIDENREARGLQPVVLPAEFADLATIPVRLLRYAPLTKRAPAAPPAAGSMIGSDAPESIVDEQAGKALSLAIDTELKQWKKVALREYRAGRKPGKRDFDYVAITKERAMEIIDALDMAMDESEVKAAFESVPFRWQNYP